MAFDDLTVYVFPGRAWRSGRGGTGWTQRWTCESLNPHTYFFTLTYIVRLSYRKTRNVQQLAARALNEGQAEEKNR